MVGYSFRRYVANGAYSSRLLHQPRAPILYYMYTAISRTLYNTTNIYEEIWSLIGILHIRSLGRSESMLTRGTP